MGVDQKVRWTWDDHWLENHKKQHNSTKWVGYMVVWGARNIDVTLDAGTTLMTERSGASFRRVRPNEEVLVYQAPYLLQTVYII